MAAKVEASHIFKSQISSYQQISSQVSSLAQTKQVSDLKVP